MSEKTETATPKIILEAIRESGCSVEVEDEEWMFGIRLTTPPGKVFSSTYRHHFKTLSVHGSRRPEDQWSEVLSVVISGLDDCPYEQCKVCRAADLATNQQLKAGTDD